MWSTNQRCYFLEARWLSLDFNIPASAYIHTDTASISYNFTKLPTAIRWQQIKGILTSDTEQTTTQRLLVKNKRMQWIKINRIIAYFFHPARGARRSSTSSTKSRRKWANEYAKMLKAINARILRGATVTDIKIT